MNDHRQRFILCVECSKAYKSSEIKALLDDNPVTTLDKIDGDDRVDAPHVLREPLLKRLLGPPRKVAIEEPAENGHQIRLDRIKRYTFKCPRDHLVDGNRGRQFTLAVVGPSGASKSHTLPALVREVQEMSALREVGISLHDPLYKSTKVTDDAAEIYREHLRLDPTPPGLLGPFPYRVRIGKRPRDPEPEERSLQLFDVNGETLDDIMRIADDARFILMADGMMVLIDPDGFLPSSFDEGAQPPPQRRIDASADVRKNIRTVVETLAEAWRMQTHALTVPFCFVIAKADAVDWPSDFEWDKQTEGVLRSVAGGTPLHDALIHASDDARDALCQLGGELVVDEIESLLDSEYVRFAVASATSCMPLVDPEAESAWMAHPEPQGVALSLLQTFDMAGIVPAHEPVVAEV